MDLFWLGHAGFRLRTGGASVIMDPFSADLGLRIPPQQAQANIVTISCRTAHHDAAEVVRSDGEPIVLDGPGEYEVAALQIRGARTPRNGGSEEAPLWNTVFLVEAESISVCHLGDPARLLTTKEMEELGTPHVLLLPVGSKGGLTAADAVEIANSVSPRLIVPMLFAHPGNRTELRELGPFLHEMGVKEPEPQGRLSVSRSSLPEEPQVVVLQPTAAAV